MKKRKILTIVAVVVLAAAAMISYRSISQKHQPKILSENASNEEQLEEEIVEADIDDESALDDSEAEMVENYQEFSAQCENGQWVDVDAVEGEKASFTGKFSVDVPFEEDEEVAVAQPQREIYYLNEEQEVASTRDDVLGFFEGKEVEISGVLQQGKILPVQIRCTGKDSDKNVQVFRQEVMNYAADRIGSLSPQKGEWEVYDIAWPADDHIYIDYAAVESDDEDEPVDDNIYSLLLQVSKDGSQVKVEQVAFLKMADDEDEEDWTVISGSDKFKDLEDMDYYEYDEDLNKWVK